MNKLVRIKLTEEEKALLKSYEIPSLPKPLQNGEEIKCDHMLKMTVLLTPKQQGMRIKNEEYKVLRKNN